MRTVIEGIGLMVMMLGMCMGDSASMLIPAVLMIVGGGIALIAERWG